MTTSYNTFTTFITISKYNPQATGLASAESQNMQLRVSIEFTEIRDEDKKKEEYLYPVGNPAALVFSTLPVSPL